MAARPSWNLPEGIRFEPRRLVSRCLVAVSMFTGSAVCWKPGFTALYCSAGMGTPARPAQLTCQSVNQAYSPLFYYAELFILQWKNIFPGLLNVWLFPPLFINGTRSRPSLFFPNTVARVTFSQGGNHDYKIIPLWLYQMSLSRRYSVYSCVCDLQVKFAWSGGLFCLSVFVQFLLVWCIWNAVFIELMWFPSGRINAVR